MINACARLFAPLTLGALFASAMLPSAFAQTYTTFDPPGSMSTHSVSINSLGDVTGYYEDASYVVHGFVRTASGTITTFDPPASEGTYSYGINSSDEATGDFLTNCGEDVCTSLGFLRMSNGTITTLNLPAFVQTNPTSINSSGDIAGRANTPSYVGFILTSGGTLTTFAMGGPYSVYINNIDDVAGTTNDAAQRPIGYVKPSGGNVTTFKVPLKSVTYVTGINDCETVTGYASDQVCAQFCIGSTVGFVRTSNGSITTFRANETDTTASAINASGEITGWYTTLRASHGFSRDTSGVITPVDPPGAIATFPAGINDSGAITGYFLKDGTLHGFILTP